MIKDSESLVKIILNLILALNMGIWTAWSMTVIPGTKKTTADVYLEVMQKINKQILHPLFFLIFLMPIAIYLIMILRESLNYALPLLVYCIGVLGVTMLGNVPLNAELEKKSISNMTKEEAREYRNKYEHRWNLWHYTRTFFAVISYVIYSVLLLNF